MTAHQLKNSILQMAVQGRLVDQNPHDEPASELLKKIQAEKIKLVKEGKIKASKGAPLIYKKEGSYFEKVGASERCIDEEIPFDIPDSWEWVRLDTIAIGVTNKKNQILSKEILQEGDFPVVSQAQSIIDGYCNDSNKVFKIDIPIIMFGDHTRNVKYIDFDFIVGADGTKFLQPIKTFPLFFYYLILFYSEQLRNRGYARHFGLLKSCLFPLPPLAEQQRIVDKIEGLLPSIGEYDKAHKEIESLNKAFPNQVKKSILQWAVQGRLVEQNPHDEPASDLLKKIQAEKIKLVKEGKIKASKGASLICKKEGSYFEKVGASERCIDEEIPFNIPDSWEWVRLGSLGQIIGGGTPKTNEINNWKNGEIPWLTPADMKFVKGIYVSKGQRNITKYGLSSSSARLLPKDSIVFSSRAPIGYIAITNNALSTNQGFKSLVPIETQIVSYIYYSLIAFTRAIQSRASGTTFKEISGSEFAETLVPLPPLAEQQRIVDKIEGLLKIIAEIDV